MLVRSVLLAAFYLREVLGHSQCCRRLYINGTLNTDPWYQNMMGIYIPFQVSHNSEREPNAVIEQLQ